MLQRFRAIVVFALLGLASPVALCQSINVLWYTYAHPSSLYRQRIQMLADVVHTLPQTFGRRWKLTFFGPDTPAPAFGDYNVLVIHSAETFYSGQYDARLAQHPVLPADFGGILKNKAAIEAARGDRTFITGSDADVHTIHGDTGNSPLSSGERPWICSPVITGPSCWDGALGHLVNAVNWAASGRGLGIVSLVAAEYPGAFWWTDPKSFLRAELQGYVTVLGGLRPRENNPVIPAAAQRSALNYGLTTKGLSNWKSSFHAGISQSIPGYLTVVESTHYPDMAVAIATAKFADIGPNGPAQAVAPKVRAR